LQKGSTREREKGVGKGRTKEGRADLARGREDAAPKKKENCFNA